MRKKLLLILLCLVLLTGCTQDVPQPTTTAAPMETTTAPVDPGLYLPDLKLEEGGALRAYQLDEPVMHLVNLDPDILLVTATDDDRVRMRVLSGPNCVVRCERVLEAGSSVTGGFRAGDNGISYYNGLEHSIVLLDLSLQEQNRIALPEEMTADPVVSQDLKTVYYCTQNEIRAMSLETGISRLLKQHNCQWQNLIGLANNDRILLCSVNQDDVTRTVFVSTQDGQTLGADEELITFTGDGDCFFLQRMDGVARENLFGDFSQEIKSFSLPDKGWSFQYVQGLNSVASVTTDDGGAGVELYSLDTGMLYAATELQGVTGVYNIIGSGSQVWFVAYLGDGQVLCCWDTDASPAQGTESFITPRYTPENPDEEGLARCRRKAEELSQRFGVRIVIDADEIQQPTDYTLTAEHQVAALEMGLESLETAMSRFPENFITRIVEDTNDKVLEICLVRGISDGQNGNNGLQYWIQANAYIAVEADYSTEQIFYHELCHVLDNFIYANTRDMDVWNSLNPEGFEYDNNYQDYRLHGNEYLEGEDRAFIDAYSRTYPKEDRARILEFAMMPGNAEYFQSETMQKKLHLLCFSIRTAFDWEKDSRAFPWERYLNEPLAYNR